MYLNNCILFSIHILADEEFDELCFEFGLELDEIVSHMKNCICLQTAFVIKGF